MFSVLIRLIYFIVLFSFLLKFYIYIFQDILAFVV